MRSILFMALLVSSCSSTKRDSAQVPAAEASRALDAAASHSSGLASPAIKPKWRECSEDGECTHVWNCRDSGTAVNKKYKEWAQDVSKFSCKYSPMTTPKMKSSCNQGICESKPTPEAKTPLYGDPMDLDEAMEAARQAHRRL